MAITQKQLCGLFLKQQKTKAESGGVNFKENILFSYGPHFPLCILKNNKEALLNVEKISVTTGKHRYLIRSFLEEAGFKIETGKTQDLKDFIRNFEAYKQRQELLSVCPQNAQEKPARKL